MYKQVCIFMYVFVCMHVYVCICTRACMYTCVYVHVCMYVSLLVTLYSLDNKHFWIKIWIESTTPNVARTISCKALNSPAKYPSWVARCDRKGSDGIMLNPISWKKVQGQKHPGRWRIVEHQIPSIKVLFNINAKSHKHPGIEMLSSESKTQLVNQRNQKVAFNPGTAHSPEIQS